MKNVAFLLIISANILGGLSYLWQMVAIQGLPPVTISALRNLVGLVCLGVLLLFRGRWRWNYTRSELARLAFIGIFAYAAPLLLGNIGVAMSTVGNASVLILMEPASILVLSWLLLHEKISRLQGVGLFFGFVGLLCIVLEDAPIRDLFTGAHLKGNLILALHGVLWGIYTPVMKPLAVKHPALELTFISMLFGMILLVPGSLLESNLWQNSPHLEEALWLTLWLGLCVSFGATLLWNISLRYLRASMIAPFIFFQPVTGLVAGYFVLKEVPTNLGFFGAAIIVLGVLLVIYAKELARRWYGRLH